MKSIGNLMSYILGSSQSQQQNVTVKPKLVSTISLALHLYSSCNVLGMYMIIIMLYDLQNILVDGIKKLGKVSSLIFYHPDAY